MSQSQFDKIKKLLASLSIEELDKIKDEIKDIRMHKAPFLKISAEFILLNVETTDLDWAGESFSGDDVTNIVITTWKISDKIYEFKSVAEGWISHGDSDIEKYSCEWITEKPDTEYIGIIELIGKYIAKSMRDPVDSDNLQKYLNDDEDSIFYQYLNDDEDSDDEEDSNDEEDSDDKDSDDDDKDSGNDGEK